MSRLEKTTVGNGEIIVGDALDILPKLGDRKFQLTIADPPYFQVLLEESWDNTWKSPDDYLDWTLKWVRECKKVLRPDGLLYVFGQLGKRVNVCLHSCSLLAKEMRFHDMIIWDRAVGYNERYDSFTPPQYKMVLALRHSANSTPYFNKDAVRILFLTAEPQSQPPRSSAENGQALGSIPTTARSRKRKWRESWPPQNLVSVELPR